MLYALVRISAVALPPSTCPNQSKMWNSKENMDPRSGVRAHFVRNSEGSSSVRLRRRKDMMAVNQMAANNPMAAAEFAGIKKRNRHSGDFYQWNYHNSNIVIPANRFSMFENRILLADPDELRMETLDRKIEAAENKSEAAIQDVWKIPMLSRPPISGTGHRILDVKSTHHRRSCDLSLANDKLIDDDVKTDVNRNVTDKSRVNSRSAAKKYHKRVSSDTTFQLRFSMDSIYKSSLIVDT